MQLNAPKITISIQIKMVSASQVVFFFDGIDHVYSNNN